MDYTLQADAEHATHYESQFRKMEARLGTDGEEFKRKCRIDYGHYQHTLKRRQATEPGSSKWLREGETLLAAQGSSQYMLFLLHNDMTGTLQDFEEYVKNVKVTHRANYYWRGV